MNNQEKSFLNHHPPELHPHLHQVGHLTPHLRLKIQHSLTQHLHLGFSQVRICHLPCITRHLRPLMKSIQDLSVDFEGRKRALTADDVIITELGPPANIVYGLKRFLLIGPEKS